MSKVNSIKHFFINHYGKVSALAVGTLIIAGTVYTFTRKKQGISQDTCPTSPSSNQSSSSTSSDRTHEQARFISSSSGTDLSNSGTEAEQTNINQPPPIETSTETPIKEVNRRLSFGSSSKNSVTNEELQQQDNLMKFVSGENLDALKSVLCDNTGMNLDFAVVGKGTPLMLACQKGNTNIALALLDNGAKLDYSSDESSETPFTIALKNGHTDLVKTLIQRYEVKKPMLTMASNFAGSAVRSITGSPFTSITGTALVKVINRENADGETPVKLACKNNNITLLKFLLDKGADVDSLAGDQSPLMTACEGESLEVVNILIQKGAKISLENGEKRTALAYALDAYLRGKNNADIINTLIDRTCKRDIQKTLSNLRSFTAEEKDKLVSFLEKLNSLLSKSED